MFTESTTHEHGLPQLKHNHIKEEFIDPIRKNDKICVGSIAEGPFSYGYQADKEVVQKSTIEKPSTKVSLTVEQKEAASTVIYSKDNVFLTGAAGTGKSFLLEYIIKRLTKKRKNGVYVTATTGIAAEHIHGTTLHSFAGIGLGKLPVEDLYESILSKESVLKRWRGARVLVVDEVSMLHADLFDKLEQLARLVRSSTEPFGGIQLVLCGDFFQLPPVDRRNSSTHSIYAFQSETWLKCNIQTITLTAVQRQTNTVFIDLLNEIRLGRFTKTAEELLRDCHISRKTVPEDGILPTKLYCLNRNVDEENINHLNMLEGSDYIYTGRDEWFPRSNIDSSSSSTATTSGSNNIHSLPHQQLLQSYSTVPQIPAPTYTTTTTNSDYNYDTNDKFEIAIERAKVNAKINKERSLQRELLNSKDKKILSLENELSTMHNTIFGYKVNALYIYCTILYILLYSIHYTYTIL